MKNNKIFKKFSIVYFSVLAILCGVFIYYVVDSLIMYENSDIEKYISNLVVDISSSANRNKIGKYININDVEISEYETSNINISEAYKNIFKSSEITYKLVADSKKDSPIYDIFADNELLFSIKLKSKGNIHRMGLLTFPDWQIDNVQFPNDRGLYYYDVNLLEGYKLYINDIEIKASNAITRGLDPELEELNKFVELPKVLTYQINNLTTEPKIKIIDESEREIKYNKQGHEINAYELYITDKVDDLNKKIDKEIDVLEIGRMWSKFLTDDLAGSYHGYSTINKYLVSDTELWNMAYEWGHGVDVTFVSNHRLLGFENEKVSDCIMYNKQAFSCVIYLEKNMSLGYGKPKQDIMHDRMYFAYYEDDWKLVSMKAITGNNED